jgi:hypothetical protein
MSEASGRALFAITLPIAAFLGGVWVMSQVSRHDQALQRLRATPAGDEEPLNRRRHYDAAAVRDHWALFDDAGLASERHFLELDLVFPFLYGGALAASLLLVWAALGRPFSPAWIVVPVAVTVVADWTENLVQLTQLRRFVRHEALQGGWIAIASAATLVKLVFIVASSVSLVVLVLVMLLRSPRSP